MDNLIDTMAIDAYINYICGVCGDFKNNLDHYYKIYACERRRDITLTIPQIVLFKTWTRRRVNYLFRYLQIDLLYAWSSTFKYEYHFLEKSLKCNKAGNYFNGCWMRKYCCGKWRDGLNHDKYHR